MEDSLGSAREKSVAPCLFRGRRRWATNASIPFIPQYLIVRCLRYSSQEQGCTEFDCTNEFVAIVLLETDCNQIGPLAFGDNRALILIDTKPTWVGELSGFSGHA
ncbi:unnamed protein product [Protopolystoma xenopodis]|uniref:Uncharacterized protein n=1 Tax=Protopolystoma xenopodis TaxID=117903 RepID=A0A448WLD9_9PLAT|nr:unnamed protein product [Protopolystoma xenopodis]